MSATVTTNSYERETTFDNIMKFMSFGISLVSAGIYVVEKKKRFVAIKTKLSKEAEDAALGKLSAFSDIFRYASLGITTIVFFDPIFREKGKFLCFDLEKDSYITRRNVAIAVFVYIALALTVVVAVKWDAVKALKKKVSAKKIDWELPIGLLTNGGSFVFGIIQIIALSNDWEYYKNRKLFSISSIIVNLSAVAEIRGIDVWLADAEKRGIVYAMVYGGRSAAKITQSVGLLTMEK